MKVMRRREFREREKERGVTMLLIALAMMSLLAMAALAIDITTLYVAQGEAQNAADAAALAGAKMFVTSGFTSIQTAATPAVGQNDVCQNAGPGNAAAANRQAEAAAAQIKIAGQAAAVQTIACDFTQELNPRITVTVQRTSLPTFFARIWSPATSTVTATATAEAYNPSGLNAPVKLESIKPWLFPNCTPSGTAGPNPNCASALDVLYINPADGTIANQAIFIDGAAHQFQKISGGGAPPPNEFYALNIPVTPDTPVCPSSGAVQCDQLGTHDYVDNIACASRFKFSCGQTIGPGNDVTVSNDPNNNPRTLQGTKCLIHADADGSDIVGQDQFDGTVPVITAGYNNPNPTLAGAQRRNISRSDSIVTVPLYDGRQLCTTSPPACTETATIVGFLQLGVTQSTTPGGFQARILNAIGCNPNASGNPVVGTGASAIPVRLIHN